MDGHVWRKGQIWAPKTEDHFLGKIQMEREMKTTNSKMTVSLTYL